ncbi:MAG: tRNA uridine-5-carboxymethylaminomethyl(34) synthesis GTPase MnmE, partial [Nitrospirae bacterium]
LRAMILRADFEPGESVVITHLRHQTALLRAKEALSSAAGSVGVKLSGEFVAMDLRASIDALGEITGAVSTDDILDRIFREFCIGK